MNKITQIKGFLHFQTFIVSFVISLIWIFGTDFIVHNLIPAEYNTEYLQNIKGVAYIFVLSLLLSWLRKREVVTSNLLMAQKKQSMLGEFSGMIVHEVKNPLHSINICIQRTKELMNNKGVDGLRYMELCEDSLNRLDETIDFLQGLSRGGSLRNLENDQDFLLTEQVRKTFEFLRKSFLGVDIKLDTSEVEGVVIKGNVSLLSHVFLNLFKNAMEYIRNEDLEDAVIYFTDESNAKSTIIGMSNTGSPIPLAIQEKLFNHFTSKSQKNGTGLGLIFCRQILKAHGGEIRYDSTSKTPKFLLYFPK